MKLNNLVQTCDACPSQWDAILDDGRGVYIRYRWGTLSVMVSNNPGEDGFDGIEIYNEQLNNDSDGVLSEAEMLDIVSRLDVP